LTSSPGEFALRKDQNPIDGGTLAYPCFTMKVTGEVVTTDDISCFAVHTGVVHGMVFCL
jgi:hypothetical protein